MIGIELRAQGALTEQPVHHRRHQRRTAGWTRVDPPGNIRRDQHQHYGRCDDSDGDASPRSHTTFSLFQNRAKRKPQDSQLPAGFARPSANSRSNFTRTRLGSTIGLAR